MHGDVTKSYMDLLMIVVDVDVVDLLMFVL